MSTKNYFYSSDNSTVFSLSDNHNKDSQIKFPTSIHRSCKRNNTVNYKSTKISIKRRKKRDNTIITSKIIHRKKVTFGNNDGYYVPVEKFVEIIDVESYKQYNKDLSRMPYKDLFTNDSCKCSCFVF